MEQSQSQEKKFVLHTRLPKESEQDAVKKTRQIYVYDSNYKEEIPYDLWIAGKACISFVTNSKRNRQNIVDAVNLIHTLMTNQNAKYTMTDEISNFQDKTVSNYDFLASGVNSIVSILKKSFETIISKRKKDTIKDAFGFVVDKAEELAKDQTVDQFLLLGQNDQSIVKEANIYLQEQKSQKTQRDAFKRDVLYQTILSQAYNNRDRSNGKRDEAIERNAVNSYWNEILMRKMRELAKQKFIRDGKEAALKSINDGMNSVATFSLEQVEVTNKETNKKETQEQLKVNLSQQTLFMIGNVVKMLNKINVELCYSHQFIDTSENRSQRRQDKTPVKSNKNSKNQKKFNEALNEFTTPGKNKAKRSKSAIKSPKKKVASNEQPQGDNDEILSPSRQRSSSVTPKEVANKKVTIHEQPQDDNDEILSPSEQSSSSVTYDTPKGVLKNSNRDMSIDENLDLLSDGFNNLATLADDNEKLKNDLSRSLKERQNLSNEVMRLNDKIEALKKLENTNQYLNTQLDQKEMEINDLKKSLEEQNDNLTKLQEQIANDKETNAQLTFANAEFQKKIDDLQKEFDSNAAERTQLQSEIKEVEEQNQTLQQDLDELNKKLKDQEKTIETLSGENAKIKAASNQVIGENKANADIVQEKTKENIKLSNELEQINAENECLKKSIAELQKEKSRLEEKFKAENEKLTEANQQLTEQNNDLNGQISKLNPEVDKELAEAKKQMDTLQKNAAATTNEQIIRNLQAELTAKKSVMKEMEDNLNQFSNNIANLNKENENLKKEIEQKNSKNDSLSSTNNELQNKLNETQEKNKALETQFNKLQQELQSKIEELEKLTEGNKNLANQIEEQKKTNTVQAAEINELEENNRSLSKKIAELTSTLEENNKEFNQTKEANRTLTDELKESKELLTKIREETEDALKKANEENAALEKSINEQKGQIQKLEAELQTKAQLENENNQLKEQVESLTQAQNEKESQTQNLTLETKLSLSQAVVPAFSFDQQNVSLSTEVIPQEEPKSEVKLAECLYGFASCCLGAALVVAACVPVVRELVGLAAFGIILAKAIGGAFLGVGVFAMGFSFRDKIKNAPARAAIANAEYQRLNQPVTNQPTLA